MQFIKCRCGKESDIEAIPICQRYVCPCCATKTTIDEIRGSWGWGTYERRPDGSIYAFYAD
jgi:hypothetical protein